MRSLTLLFLIFFSCQPPQSSTGGWRKIYQNNAAGEAAFGNKDLLIDAVRLGYPVRVGWGGGRVEHVADASFLTIFEGEVFAQMETIVGQAPRIDGDSIKIRFRTQNHWTKIAGTNGYSTAFMTDYFQDTLAGGGIDRYRPATWYVLYPEQPSEIEARPLWHDNSPYWEKWHAKEK